MGRIKWLTVPLVCVLVVMGLAIPASANSKDTASNAQPATAERSINPDSIAPGNSTEISVNISANKDWTKGFMLDEDPPESWNVTPVENAGCNFVKSKVSWFSTTPLKKGESKTIIYKVTAPKDAKAKDYTVSGNLTTEFGKVTVTGESVITVSIATAPTVETDEASDIAYNSATLNGNLTALGTAASVDVSFEWGKTSGGPYPNETPPQSMNSTGTFSANLTGLLPGNTYYFRAKAVGDGVSYGNVKSFTTPPGSLSKGEETDVLTTIPKKARNLKIGLNATADLDLRLYDGNKLVVGYKGVISSPKPVTGTYEGDKFIWSGYKGIGNNPGREFIKSLAGPLGRDYNLKVRSYASSASKYTVKVNYTLAPPTPKPVLEATVSPESESTSVGSAVNFTVTVENTGGANATDVAVNATSACNITFTEPSAQDIAKGKSANFTVSATPNEKGEDMPINFLVSCDQGVKAETSATLTATTAGIVNYYRSLGKKKNVVEKSDLAKALTDWRDKQAPDGFNQPLTSKQLLTLIEEWSG